MNKTFNFIDLFSGIGGFHQVFANFGGKAVLASDIDEAASQVYWQNYHLNSKIDIKKITEKHILKLPNNVQVLAAGFPCQSFSNAGKKKGFKDKKNGSLIYSVQKIVKLLEKNNKKPKIIILENVKHLIKHNDGKTFQEIKNIFENLNYITLKNPLIISPHQIGIPQHRPRVIIPFILNSSVKKEIILQRLEKIRIQKSIKLKKTNIFLKKNVNPKYLITDPYINKIFCAWSEFIKNVKRPRSRTLPVIWLDEFGKNYSLINLSKWKQKYIYDIRNLYLINKIFIDDWMKKWNTTSWKTRDKKLEWQAGKDNFDLKNSFIQLRQSGVRCRKKKMFPALVAMVQIPIIYDHLYKSFRFLTPRETANIQSFSKNFQIHQSDFHAYKQFGNAVNVEVIKYVFDKLICFL